MSTDFSIRPVGAPAATTVVLSSSDAVSNGKAEIAPPGSSGFSISRARPPPGDFISHQAFIDQAAASIVYQVVDSRTNAVVAQYPDEAVLRRRAYFHTLDLTKGEPTRPLATDRKA